MRSFRYQAMEVNGTPVKGVIDAEDRKAALQLLGERGLFPSSLEICASTGALPVATPPLIRSSSSGFRLGKRIRRKEITAFTREMAALLGAAIPIPQALDGLGEEEENPALREVVLKISESVRKGAAFSAALEEHPRFFDKLYVSMVRVGEEAGVLQKVMADLAQLLEHEDEVRGEIVAAVSYPVFVLCFGLFTVTILLTVVLPRLFSMLEEMLQILPLPTLILLKISGGLHRHWPWIVTGLAAAIWGLRWYRPLAPRRLGLGPIEASFAVDGLRFSHGRPGPVCPDPGDAGEERGLPSARAEDCREHDWQPGLGEPDRARGGGDTRRRFPGHSSAQAGHFSGHRRSNDQRGGRKRDIG